MSDISQDAQHMWRGAVLMLTRAVIAACLALALGQHAAAQDANRWLADEGEARAVLPSPGGSKRVTTASLSCVAQRWNLRFELEEKPATADGPAVLTIDAQPFELSVSAEDGALIARVPRPVLVPLKNGLRMQITFPGAAGDATFSLRGSKLAIDAVEENCSLRDMSAYTPLTFTPYSSYAGLARELRADDIAAFVTSTTAQPQVSVAMVELGEGRRLLFTRLCGSSWYYGLSGCNITGFAPDAPAEADGDARPAWRAVYDTENVALHLDRKSLSHGWPDLVTLLARGGGMALVWRWNGQRYALKGELPEQDDAALPLRPSHE